MTKTVFSSVALLALAVAGCTGEAPSPSGVEGLEEASLEGNPDELLWGDLHLHSNLSFDAYTFGTNELGPEEAYRFASGERVTSSTGVVAQLQRPLDFLMVSDHAEFLGLMNGIAKQDELIASYPLAQRWADHGRNGRLGEVLAEFGAITQGDQISDPVPRAFQRRVWDDVVEAAEKYNKPGKFTTFVGYEWTSIRTGDNLHRVVVFADGPEKTRQTLPFSALDSSDPEDLWSALQAYVDKTGGRVMSIPHNGNLSEGDMFADTTFGGGPMTASYRQTRLKFEPVVEVTQVKGDGEAHPILSPEDQFADFESWDETDLASNPRTKDQSLLRKQMAGEYARGALKKGLRFAAEDGINPFEFGMIGSTDMHTALAAAGEDNFFGKFPDSEPSVRRLASSMGGVLWGNATLTSSGYIGVWARANTRDEIFSAMERREVYASTGPRIRLRMFGGWDFTKSVLDSEAYVDAGYERGVPMGGALEASDEGDAPGFLLVAAKDPDGAHLDRIQIVKGWLDKAGKLHEKIYDVALSDGRMADPKTGKAPALKSTVDVSKATYTNDIGSSELRTFWVDPDFDPSEQAFYYARVLQIPTPRWTTYDAVRFGLSLPKNVPAEIQDRVYGSPIWYRAKVAK